MDPILKWLKVNCSFLEILLSIPIAFRQRKHHMILLTDSKVMELKFGRLIFEKMTAQWEWECLLKCAAKTKLFHVGE